MGVNFDDGPLEGIGVAKIATGRVPTVGELEQALRDATCEHIATVTTPAWPIVHRSPVHVGDDVHVLPPVLVTECVTCGVRVDLDAPRFTADLGEQP